MRLSSTAIALTLAIGLGSPEIAHASPSTVETCCRGGGHGSHSYGAGSHGGSHSRSSGGSHSGGSHHYSAPRAPRLRSTPSYHAPRVRTPRPHATPRAKSPRATLPHTSRPRARAKAPGARDSHGRLERSRTAKEQFMKKTGHPRGWPGHVIDHIVPLACGGSDAPSNMQWQTTAEAKAKDRVERLGCRR